MTLRKTAPSDDADLHWLFCWSTADMGLCSGFGAIANMAASGIMVRGSASGDERLLRESGSVEGQRVIGVRGEVSATTKERLMRSWLATLTQRQRDVLWLAYGPHSGSLQGGAASTQLRGKLGHFWAVIAATPVVLDAWSHMQAKRAKVDGYVEPHDAFAIWLRDAAPRIMVDCEDGVVRSLLDLGRRAAAAMVNDAWGAWNAQRKAWGDARREKRERRERSVGVLSTDGVMR